MASRMTERREATREGLATTILALLCFLVATLVTAAVFQRALHLPIEAVRLLERMFLAVLGLAALVARWYFR